MYGKERGTSWSSRSWLRRGAPYQGRKTWIRGGLFFFVRQAKSRSCIRGRIYICTHIHSRGQKRRGMTSEWQDNELGLMHANALWRFNMYIERERLHFQCIGNLWKARISPSIHGKIPIRRHGLIEQSRDRYLNSLWYVPWFRTA